MITHYIEVKQVGRYNFNGTVNLSENIIGLVTSMNLVRALKDGTTVNIRNLTMAIRNA